MAVAETAVVMAHAAAVIPPRVVGRVLQSEGKLLVQELEVKINIGGIAASPTTEQRPQRQRDYSMRRDSRRLF